MATAKETEAKLAKDLESVSTSKTVFNKVRKAYDIIHSDKAYATVKANVLVIGGWIAETKDKFADKKSNLNSGDFGAFVKRYFPRLSAQDISTYQWYSKNQLGVDVFLKDKKLNTCRPEQMKRMIGKDLKDRKNTTKADYEEFGLKVPKGSTSGKSVDNKAEVKDSEGKVIKSRPIDKMDNNEVLDWIDMLTAKLQERKANNAGQFLSEQIAQMDLLAMRLSDLSIDITTQQKKKGLNTKTGTNG